MSCLHCRFRIKKYHISAPTVTPTWVRTYQAGSLICAICGFFFGRIRTFIVNSSQWEEFFSSPHLAYLMTNPICTRFFDLCSRLHFSGMFVQKSIYIYIYRLSSTDRLFRCNTTLETLCWAFVVMGCVGASQRISLLALARNPHKGPGREISHETGRTREGRSERREKKAVSRREQKRSVGIRGRPREGHSQQKGAAETSRQNGQSGRWESGWEETSQQKSERRLLGPADPLTPPGWPTREFNSALLVALWEFFARVHARVSSQNAQKVSQTSLSCSWS